MKRRNMISLILAFGLFLIGSAACAQDRGLVARAEQISGDRFALTTSTPKGATVYAVSQPTAAMLNAIDKGLADLFAVARKNGYRKYLNFSDYTIFIARPDRLKDSAGKYSPDIAVGAGQYAGSVYDKGGFIYAAGMVTSFDPGAFLIAEHTQDLNRVSNVVRYEGEHIVLYHNDRRRFLATQDHSKGGGHPILQ
ncbi:MAG TPA: hypothetical protein VGJ02_01570 [Pyrinomonadaceae bacterium]|jgi:hypothetical protein